MSKGVLQLKLDCSITDKGNERADTIGAMLQVTGFEYSSAGICAARPTLSSLSVLHGRKGPSGDAGGPMSEDAQGEPQSYDPLAAVAYGGEVLQPPEDPPTNQGDRQQPTTPRCPTSASGPQLLDACSVMDPSEHMSLSAAGRNPPWLRRCTARCMLNPRYSSRASRRTDRDPEVHDALPKSAAVTRWLVGKRPRKDQATASHRAIPDLRDGS